MIAMGQKTQYIFYYEHRYFKLKKCTLEKSVCMNIADNTAGYDVITKCAIGQHNQETFQTLLDCIHVLGMHI